jgi:hypothetical protein
MFRIIERCIDFRYTSKSLSLGSCCEQEDRVDEQPTRRRDARAAARRLVGPDPAAAGTVTPCGTFTKTDALVVQEIWQG